MGKILDALGRKLGPTPAAQPEELSDDQKIRRGLMPDETGEYRSDVWPPDAEAPEWLGLPTIEGEEDVGRPAEPVVAESAPRPDEVIWPLDWFIVEPEGEKLQTEVGVHLVRDQKEGARARRGTIIARPFNHLLGPGDTVIFLRYAGVDFELGPKTLVALREADIIGVVRPVIDNQPEGDV